MSDVEESLMGEEGLGGFEISGGEESFATGGVFEQSQQPLHPNEKLVDADFFNQVSGFCHRSI
jgi:hypothetical protein